ncbi:hypothetical protein BC830DRAFT_1059205 [Chytriomyces sp. MP71]|nr:hypothetical protein BC830DRAFT_1059205 [Chytriomyces sp. MP71]
MDVAKKSQASIQAEVKYNQRVKEENRLAFQRGIINRNRVVAFVSSWQDNAISVSIKSELKKIKESTLSEIEMANHELLILRRKQISDLLTQDMDKYKLELAKLNLAIYEERK